MCPLTTYALQALPVGVIIVDAEGTVATWNPAAEQFIEAVGRPKLYEGMTLSSVHGGQHASPLSGVLERIEAKEAIEPKLVTARNGDQRFRVHYIGLFDGDAYQGVAQVIVPLDGGALCATDVLECRRSIRKFSGRPVSRETVEALLRAGRLAPSAANLQPTRVLVADTEERLSVLRSAAYGIDPVASAPLVLVLMTDLDADARVVERVRELHRVGAMEPVELSALKSGRGEPFALKLGPGTAVMNACVAGTYIEVAAAALGLGACWVHHADFKQIADAFAVPSNFEIVSLLAVGYAAEHPEPRPRIPSIEWLPGDL